MLPSGTFSSNYGQDMGIIRTRMQWGLLAAGLILLFTLPFWLPNIPVLGTDIIPMTTVVIIGIYIIAVMGLQIIMGYAGQISFGHTAFMAVGAYTAALMTQKLGISFWLALPCAGLAAGLIGILFGAAAFRLKGFSLVVATVAAQIVIIWLLNLWVPVTGGDYGMSVDNPTIGPFTFDSDTKYFYLIWVFVILGTFVARNLVRTRIGRAFIAVRDSEIAAKVLGINIFSTKLLAFFIGCMYAGFAGVFLVYWQGFAFPNLFGWALSVQFLTYLIVGGLSSTAGVFFGVVLLEALNNGLSSGIIALGAPTFAIYAKDFTMGLILILVLVFEPRGMAHRWEIFKTYYRLWPYTR